MRALVLCGLLGCATGTLATTPGLDRVAYPNGKARFEFELRDGIPNGRGRSWHANGKLASDGTYQDGARHGRFWFYNDDGTFSSQALYVENAEVWHSTDQHVEPPVEWTKQVAIAAHQPDGAPADATVVELGPEVALDDERTAPRPYFSTLDRTTFPARAGAQVGVGDAKDLGFGAAMRLDVFAHYRTGNYGVFAQLTETQLAVTNAMTLGGRRAAILAGTYHRALGPATLSATGGLIAAIGNADVAGSVASYAGAEQRPADAAIAIPAPFALRSAASLTARRGPFVVQADAGIDWLLAGDEHGLDALARANFGIGFGSRSTLLTAELDNSLHVSGSQAHLHALALGGTLAYPMVWISASLAFSFAGTTSFLASVGHDL